MLDDDQEKSFFQSTIEKLSQDQLIEFFSKKRLKHVTNCPHYDKPHYAKGMCNYCYHM